MILYELEGNDALNFSIDPYTGIVTTASVLDRELVSVLIKNLYNVRFFFILSMVLAAVHHFYYEF